MRRSSAPSVTSGKRPRFVPPFLNKGVVSNSNLQQRGTEIKNGQSHSTPRSPVAVVAALSATTSTTPSVLQQICINNQQQENNVGQSFEECQLSQSTVHQHQLAKDNDNSVGKEIAVTRNTEATDTDVSDESSTGMPAPGYCTSVSDCYNACGNTNPDSPKPVDAAAAIQVKYYSVVWGKISKRKHKKWEGDAVLIARGKSVTLLNMDGKEIGKGTGYKLADISSLDEGNTLYVGGKLIEVMGKLAEEDYTTGRCFGNAASLSHGDDMLSEDVLKSGKAKPFINPSLHVGSGRGILAKCVDSKPLYNPNSPNVLVMPQPGVAHQMKHNADCLPVVDVICDPYLCQHLRPHQRSGVTFLYECVMGYREYNGNGAILADDMGLGKTLQCIALIWTLLKQGPYGRKPILQRVIIVTPGSLINNWRKEFKIWLGDERIKVYAVSQSNKLRDYLYGMLYPVLIISYEMFVKCVDKLKTMKFDLMVCDEAHRLKNTNIKTTSCLLSLGVKRKVLLTGTPIQNDLREFYAIIDFCNPNILGSYATFRCVYEDKIVSSKQPAATGEERRLGDERAAELNRLTSAFVLRRTQDVNKQYLPPKVESVIFCRPSPVQRDLYRRVLCSGWLRRCVRDAGQGAGQARHLACISLLKKLCNHPRQIYPNPSTASSSAAGSAEYVTGECDTMCEVDDLYRELGMLGQQTGGGEGGELRVEDSGKLLVLTQMLASLHANRLGKMVIVSNYTKTLDMVEGLCKRREYQYLRLDGATNTGKRLQLVEQFNKPYTPQSIFLLSSKAGGVGLNLIGATRLVLYDIDWNPANDLQAMARVWRDGQTTPVYIYRLLTTGSVEEKIYQRQISKQSLSGGVIDTSKTCSDSTRQTLTFSREDLKRLFTFSEDTSCDTHDLLQCDCVAGCSSDAAAPDAGSAGAGRGGGSTSCLGMDELLNWQHVPRGEQIQELALEDQCLLEASEHITFMFRNIVTLTPKTEDADA